MRLRFLGALVGLVLVLVGAGALAAAARMVEPKPLTEFTLTENLGHPFSLAALRDRWTIVVIGYTSCPDVCPFVLTNLEAVLEALSTQVTPERLPQIVFLAVDPARNAPVLADYMRSFHPAFRGVTGDEREVARLVAGLDGVVRREAPDLAGNYLVAHSAFVSVVDPAGRVVARLEPPLDPKPTASFLVGLLRGTAAG